MTSYSNIPTNIISGFLGAGKTTAIQHLLNHKPDNERWAVIVNEFGQIGIDGALLKSESVEIKEIPGGCLCCVGSQSLNVGLNQIIRTVKPQRILIEPTGLGHPAKLITSLSGEFYQSVLDLKAVINLLDARQLADKRYTENETFIDQSTLADVLVASKLDTYSETDKQQFYNYAMSFEPEKIKVAMVEQGRLPLDWLNLERRDDRQAVFPQSHHHGHEHSDKDSCNVHKNWLMVEGQGNGYSSTGWKINTEFQFLKSEVINWLTGLLDTASVERVKGVVFTDQGWVSVNYTRHEQKILDCEADEATLLEIISSEFLDSDRLDAQFRLQLI